MTEIDEPDWYKEKKYQFKHEQQKREELEKKHMKNVLPFQEILNRFQKIYDEKFSGNMKGSIVGRHISYIEYIHSMKPDLVYISQFGGNLDKRLCRAFISLSIPLSFDSGTGVIMFQKMPNLKSYPKINDEYVKGVNSRYVEEFSFNQDHGEYFTTPTN